MFDVRIGKLISEGVGVWGKVVSLSQIQTGYFQANETFWKCDMNSSLTKPLPIIMVFQTVVN